MFYWANSLRYKKVTPLIWRCLGTKQREKSIFSLQNSVHPHQKSILSFSLNCLWDTWMWIKRRFFYKFSVEFKVWLTGHTTAQRLLTIWLSCRLLLWLINWLGLSQEFLIDSTKVCFNIEKKAPICNWFKYNTVACKAVFVKTSVWNKTEHVSKMQHITWTTPVAYSDKCFQSLISEHYCL